MPPGSLPASRSSSRTPARSLQFDPRPAAMTSCARLGSAKHLRKGRRCAPVTLLRRSCAHSSVLPPSNLIGPLKLKVGWARGSEWVRRVFANNPRLKLENPRESFANRLPRHQIPELGSLGQFPFLHLRLSHTITRRC